MNAANKLCVYDNPDTMKREWHNSEGKLICFYSAELLYLKKRPKQLDKAPEWKSGNIKQH